MDECRNMSMFSYKGMTELMNKNNETIISRKLYKFS